MSGVSVHIADRGEVQERPVVRRLEQHAGPRLLRSALLHGNPRHPLILTMDTCAGRRFGCSRAGTTGLAPLRSGHPKLGRACLSGRAAWLDDQRPPASPASLRGFGYGVTSTFVKMSVSPRGGPAESLPSVHTGYTTWSLAARAL